jgi:hypothetical protein
MEYLTNLALFLRGKILYYSKLFYFIFFNVEDIVVIEPKRNELKNINLRYYFLTYFDSFIDILKNIRNYFDIELEKIHVVRVNECGKKFIILESENNQRINLKSIINKLKNLDTQNDNIFDTIKFLKFDLERGDDSICLKNFLENYKDIGKNHHNTIENILLFNKINYSDDSSINLNIFDKGRLVTKKFNIKDVLKWHIREFYQIKY